MFRTKYVAAGVRTDVDKLLKKFVEGNIIKFSKFTEVWREMKFSLIFMGRPNPREKTELTESCFRIAISIWNPRYSFEYQVGAFYLLFAFYKKQLSSPRDKIRMKLEEWQYLIKLMNECKENLITDANYLFFTLCEDNAFQFVFQPNLMGPRTSLIKSDVIETEVRWQEITSSLGCFVKGKQLDSVVATHDLYQKLKESLSESVRNDLMITENVADLMSKKMKEFLMNKTEGNYKSHAELAVSENELPEESIGLHRANLRKKIFSTETTLLHSRRTVIRDCDTVTKEPDSSAVDAEKKRRKRKTLKNKSEDQTKI